MIALVLFLLTAAPADSAPGWIGIGYHYRVTDGRGWMLIQHLDPSGPAGTAGLRPRDLVTLIDGKPLKARDHVGIMMELRRVKPGQKVTFTVRRGEQTLPIVFIAAKMTPQQERMWREALAYERARATPR
jgi:C-terminal processing protease CtpA/Prc